MEPIRVVIIDDNKDIRFVVKEILDMEDDVKLCGEAETFEQGKSLLTQSRPDVAIIDISLDKQDGGFAFLKEIPPLNLQTKVIMFSAHGEDVYAEKSLKAGAKGYVCKDKTVKCLVSAIRTVHAGKNFVSTNC